MDVFTNSFIVKNRTRVVIILLILLILSVLYFNLLRAGIFIALFIILGGLSKIYHRFIKSSIGIDLVLFFTIMTALVYNNTILALIVGWIGLIAADTIGLRFSHSSVITLIGLTVVAIISRMIISLPFIVAAIILVAIFEVVAIILYSMMGSSPQRILLFIATHILFNLFLVLSFAQNLKEIMI